VCARARMRQTESLCEEERESKRVCEREIGRDTEIGRETETASETE